MPEKKKKHRFLKGLLITLLVIVLLAGALAASAAAYLQFSTLEYDSGDTLSSASDLSPEKRWLLDADAGELALFCDKADLYWALERDNGSILGMVRETAGEYGLELTDWGFFLRPGQLELNLRLLWKGKLPLPLSVRMDAGCENGVLTFSIAEARVGRSIRLPLDTLCRIAGISRDELSWELKLTDYSAAAANVSRIELTEGGLTLHIGLGSWLWQEAQADRKLFVSARSFARESPELDALLSAIDSGDYSGLLALFDGRRWDYPALRQMILSYSPGFGRDAYFNSANRAFLSRFLPGVDESGAQAAAASFRDAAYDGEDRLLLAAQSLKTATRSQEWRLAQGGMRNLWSWAVCSVSEVMGSALADCAGLLDASTVRAVLITGTDVEYRGFPVLGSLVEDPREDWDDSLSYGVGFAARMASGAPFLLYERYRGGLGSVALTEEEFAAMGDALTLVVCEDANAYYDAVK